MSGWPSNARIAGKYHSWCADCGAKVHMNADSCSRCGAGEGGQAFRVKYKGNVGKSEYTTDSEGDDAG